MSNKNTQSENNIGLLNKLKYLIASIGTKIVLPYMLLTLIVAGAGAFIVTRLVTSSLQERFNNQLLDAGRVVSETMVTYEADRLEVLRLVAGTTGVPEALANNDRTELSNLVPQIIANSNTDMVELLDTQGKEVYGWQRPPGSGGSSGEDRFDSDYSHLEEVRRVLNGYQDAFGEKRVQLTDTSHGLMVVTLGPVKYNGELVGVVMVGTYVKQMVFELTQVAVARVTLYDSVGRAIETTLGGGQEGVSEIIQEPPGQYTMIIQRLAESENNYKVIVEQAQEEVPLKKVEVLGQEYTLAFGDWRIRNQSFGLFSVALPTNFIISTTTYSRNVLSVLFFLATVAVFAVGFFIAQRIIQPLNKLVQTSQLIAAGDLKQRTEIKRRDEIGTLAQSFDIMTENLIERNQRLAEKSSELETIVDSITDGIIVLSLKSQIVHSNYAANKILADMSEAMEANMMHELPPIFSTNIDETQLEDLENVDQETPAKRYKVGTRMFSTKSAPMRTADGEIFGNVVTLRDITREAEAEARQDSFITSVSHELRTPLTAIKGFSELLMKIKAEDFKDNHIAFIKKINNNANRLIRHINELIDITEIQAGSLAIQKERFSLNQVTEEAIANWREKIEERELDLVINLPNKTIFINGDNKRLKWAINNLVNNAYQYTPKGSIKIDVFEEDNTARLDITDTGVGIPTTDQPYLFTRFFRANKNHEFTFNVDGVGLGLFITRSIVELHDGKAWAKSQVGKGSTFSIALPLDGNLLDENGNK